ncbi:MAG: hypothetical protein KatS3mg113_0591 [Planctomycetaceae bacterium]|nr:MAG: hypothetical protein KatS3mg113_0591 [Planctomycetaceae bacterium]
MNNDVDCSKPHGCVNSIDRMSAPRHKIPCRVRLLRYFATMQCWTAVNRLNGGRTVLVPMNLVRIIISEWSPQHVIMLRECEGDRVLTIMIGVNEALSIERGVKGETFPRPMTHDLLKNIFEALDAQVDSVVITKLVEGTYYAVIRYYYQGELQEIDSRPSDAIALAVLYRPFLPIYVEEEILERIAM